VIWSPAASHTWLGFSAFNILSSEDIILLPGRSRPPENVTEADGNSEILYFEIFVFPFAWGIRH